MQTHARTSSLDELVIDALSNPSEPVVRPTESYFKIEVIREDDLDLDIAVTGRFLRWSAPYERIDLDAALGSPPFAQPAETVAFDKQWFEDADDAVAAIAAVEEAAVEPAGSWRWLAISVAIAGIAVAVAEYAL
jgi:hypothetical protein